MPRSPTIKILILDLTLELRRMHGERMTLDTRELAAAFETLQCAARDGVRITITFEREPPPPEWRESAAAWVRTLRHRLLLTQTQLAQRLGVSNHTISLWESGNRTPRHRRTVQALNAIAAEVEMPPLPRATRVMG